MIDKDYELQWESIEAILEEASRFNLRFDVELRAELYLEQDPELNIVDAYEMAYDSLINQN